MEERRKERTLEWSSSFPAAQNVSCVTRNWTAYNFDSYPGICFHPERLKLQAGQERVIATKHICYKVVFRAQKTIQKVPTVNISTVLYCIFFFICVGRIKLGRRRREKTGGREEQETFHTHSWIHPPPLPFFPQFIQEVHLCFTLCFHTVGALFSHSLKGYIKKPRTRLLFRI